MRYDVTVSKSVSLDTVHHPCYPGQDYTDQEYLKLGQIIKEKFHCTSPFIPRQARHGADICRERVMGRKVMNFMRTNLAYWNPNMWRSGFYFKPPCTFYEFSFNTMFRRPG